MAGRANVWDLPEGARLVWLDPTCPPMIEIEVPEAPGAPQPPKAEPTAEDGLTPPSSDPAKVQPAAPLELTKAKS